MKILKQHYFGFWGSLFYSTVLWGGFSLLTVFFAFVDILIAFPVSLLFDKGTRWKIHQITFLWARLIISGSSIWRLVVTGRQHLRKDRHYIIVANHQSLLDILAVCAALPVNFKFLAKRELFQIPFMGWAMSLANYIPVDRASHKSGREAMQRISRVLGTGVSVLLFPEGTRSPDGKIHAFKPGAFKLARDNKVELLPVVVDGTGQALPKRSMIVKKKSTFIVSIGKPVPVDDLSDRSLDEVKERIRHEMATRLARLRHDKKA